MRAISIRQPWAALVALGIKDIENRPWRTSHRGPILIHASQGRSTRTLSAVCADHGIPLTDELVQLCALKGGVIGMINVVDCVSDSESRWFDRAGIGSKPHYGFVLRDARVLPFVPAIGRLGLFDISDSGTEPGADCMIFDN